MKKIRFVEILIVLALAVMVYEVAQAHSHSWMLISSSNGEDAWGNPVKICNWRCASDRNHTTTTSGNVCSYPY